MSKGKFDAVKVGKKGFINAVIILFVIIIAVGIATYIIPAGQYLIEDGVVTDKFEFLPDSKPLPFYRWFTAPIEVWFSSSGITLIFISLFILILGGTFTIMGKTGSIQALINTLICKFKTRRYGIIWAITFFFMLLAATFGISEEGLVLLPIVLILCSALGWDSVTAMCMTVLAAGVGFAATLTNPFSIGMASSLAGTNILTGIWFRLVLFVLLWVVASLFTCHIAKKSAEKNHTEKDAAKIEEIAVNSPEDEKKVKVFLSFFVAVLALMIICCVVPVLVSLMMPVLAAAFLIGSLICGTIITKDFKLTVKHFLYGAGAIAPSIIILMISASVKTVAENGKILHTLFYYISGALSSTGPYLAIVIIFFTILLFEFFISSSSAKVMLLIPLLTLLPIAGISKELIILAFALGDGFTNAFFPTNSALLVALNLSEISYGKWFRKTALFQLGMIIFSVAALLLALLTGY